MEEEGVLARQQLLPAMPGQRFLQHLKAPTQRVLEALLLRGEDVQDELALALQLGVGAGHPLDRCLGEV